MPNDDTKAKAAAEAAAAATSTDKQPAAQQPAPQQPSAQSQVRLTKGAWRERARALGASPHAIAGALHDRDADEELSEAEVRGALDQFSVREGLE